jgi:hypothetical protein
MIEIRENFKGTEQDEWNRPVSKAGGAVIEVAHHMPCPPLA